MKIDQRTFKQPEHFADGGDDDVFDLRARQHQLQRVGEIFQNDDGGRTAVFQLMLQLARRIERIGVHRHQTCLQNTEKGNRILQYVRHHNGNTFAARQLEDVLQIRGEIGRQFAGFGISERFAHILKSGQTGKFFHALAEYVADGIVLRDVDFGTDALLVAF